MRKQDRRNAYTEGVIRDAVFELLKKKSIERISVTEVCKLAEINRSTFYLHYMDCMDVLEKEQERFCDKLIAFMEGSKQERPIDIVEQLHRLIREDHNLYLLLMSSYHPLNSFKKFTDYARSYLTEYMQKSCSLTREQCDWVAQYIITGSFAISLMFAEETQPDMEREEIFQILTAQGMEGLAQRYPRRQ